MAVELKHGEAGEQTLETHIPMPAGSFWPMVFAFGLTLMAAGLVTHWVISTVGFILFVRAGYGWWHNVIPHEEHEAVEVDVALRPTPIEVETRSVVRLEVGQGGHRVRVPEKIHPYSSGLWGGLAGGAAMALLACLYGLIAQHSIWYPVNLLAGVVIPDLGNASVAQLRSFIPAAFIAASLGHITISIMVGVLYAVMLPMFPKYAPFWAGVLMPVIWSGLVATTLNVLNPALNSRISWPWFVVCQLGFGLVGGFFIARSTHIRTLQSWSLADRAFLHTAPPESHPDEGSK
jgi:hypothetical protein